MDTIVVPMVDQTVDVVTDPAAGPFAIEPREIRARMDSEKVRSILEMGYSRELVRQAIQRQLINTGETGVLGPLSCNTCILSW